MSENRNDRRRHPRKKLAALVYVDLGPSNGGMLRDVSEGGMGFRAVGPMRTGEKVKFAFAFDGRTRLQGDCELIWTEEDGKAGGLQFAEVSEELREEIRKRITVEQKPEEPIAEPPLATTTPVATLEEIRREIRQPGLPPQAAGAARRAARMRAEPAPAERTEPQPEAPAIPPMVLTPRVAEVAEEIKIETKPEICTENKPEPEPEPRPEAKPELSPEVRPAVWPNATFLRAAATRVSEEAMESRDEEMPGARWVDELTLSRAIWTMLALTLLVGGYVYHRAVGKSVIWLGQQIAGEEAPGAQTTPLPAAGQRAPAAQNVVPQESPRSLAAETPSENRTQAPLQQEPERSAETAKPSTPVPVPTVSGGTANDRETPAPAAQAPKNEGNGQTEFLQALQILRGKNRGGEFPEAVRLLWVAVEKGNSGAEVALADLYRRGEGMPQNCAQTRVLLTAAARKGNTEAKRRLEQLDREGCP